MQPAPDELARLDALVGRVLVDKYRLRACIGVGGSGAVFRADQLALGRTVAVKLLASALADDPGRVRRFQDEALAASRLNHPNTVSVIDYGQSADGLLFMVMELVKGPTLGQLVAEQHPLPVERVLELMAQVLAGIEEAHHAGIVHADLKCDNVIVDQRRADWEVAKVLDFGIARLLHEPADDTPGEDRKVAGTPEYLAPELVVGGAPTPASDLYAAGVVFYELLAGAPPFSGGTAHDVMTRQLREAPAPASARRGKELPADVEAILAKALAKSPADRFPDAAAFRAAVLQLRDARRAHRSGNLAFCDACGAHIPARFRFCPECGQLRQASTVPPLPGGGLAAAATLGVAPAVAPAPEPPAAEEPSHPWDPRALLFEHFTADTTPTMVAVLGAPGSGRSALLADAYRQAAAERGLTVYRATPDPSGLATPLYPVRAVLASMLALPPTCSMDDVAAAGAALGLAAYDQPGLGELFGHGGALSELEPMVRRREVIAATVRAMHAAVGDTQTVVAFEQLDAYDHPSQELVRRLAERGEECPALRLAITCRPELAARWPGLERVEAAPLDDAALAASSAGLADDGLPDPPTGAQLRAATGGLAGHLAHLAAYLQEGGAIDDHDTLADLVAARISLLPQSVLEVAQGAAVFGREADRGLLQHLLELPARALEAHLGALIARGLLEDLGGAVAFTSGVVRDIVYDATPADVRRHLHRAAAALLATTGADPAVLGHHHELAGDPEQAAGLLAEAGARAAHYLDDDGAIALLQRAHRALRQLVYAGGDDDVVQRFVALSSQLADALCASGHNGLAKGVVAEARPWSAGAPRLQALLSRAAAHLALGDDDLEGATAQLRAGIGEAIGSGDGSLIAGLYLELASALTRGGDPAGAERELREGVDLVTLGEGMSAANGPPEAWRMLLRIGQLSAARGDQADALRTGEYALAHARRVDSRAGIARTQVMLATACELLGESERAARYRVNALAELRAVGDHRATSELLMTVAAPTRTLLPFGPQTVEVASPVEQVEVVAESPRRRRSSRFRDEDR